MACKDVAIESNDAMKNGVGVLAEIKTKYKEVDAKRRSFIDPLGEVIDKINAEFSPALDALAGAEKVLKKKVAGFVESRHAERDALIAEVQNQDAQADRVALIERAEAKIPPKVSGLSVRELWGGKVIDKEALVRWAIENDRIDLLKVDEPMLKQMTKSAGRDPGIPGWVAECKRSVAITPGKVKPS